MHALDHDVSSCSKRPLIPRPSVLLSPGSSWMIQSYGNCISKGFAWPAVFLKVGARYSSQWSSHPSPTAYIAGVHNSRIFLSIASLFCSYIIYSTILDILGKHPHRCIPDDISQIGFVEACLGIDLITACPPNHYQPHHGPRRRFEASCCKNAHWEDPPDFQYARR